MKTCECGCVKAPKAKQCPRCADLDGHTGPEGRLISAFRQRGAPCDIYELARLADIAIKNVYCAIKPLVKRGRVVVLRRGRAQGETTIYGLREVAS